MPRTFGVEIEMIGPRRLLAESIAKALDATIEEVIDAADPTENKWLIETADRRVWLLEDDDSLGVPLDLRAELVTPILTESDLDLLAAVVAALRHAGGTVSERCGVHVHVGSGPCAVEHLNRAIDHLQIIEPIVMDRMLGMHAGRRTYTKLLDPSFVDAFRAARPATYDAFWTLWYGTADYQARMRDRYDRSRYRGFNLHSHAYRGTVEFRYFNATLDPQRILEYVRLCLGIAEHAGFPIPGDDT